MGGWLIACGEPHASEQPLAPPSQKITPGQPIGLELPVRNGLAGRLTPQQYRNVVGDVLGVELDDAQLSLAGAVIPQEQPSTGLFRNGAEGQAAGDAYALAFARAASEVARRVDIATLLGSACSLDAACARAFVEAVGMRLFKRPLSERERDAFTALHGAVAAEGLDFEHAARSVIEAMLQSPAFVFRLERELDGSVGQKRYLDGFELASRLAFFVWDSAPDAKLLELASSNALNGTVEALPVLREQTARLLEDPRARRMTREFVRGFASPERAVFLGVTPELRTALFESMVASVDAHLWEEQQPIRELFTTTRLSFDPTVATLLGLTPEGEGQRIYDVSALPERVGWLSHPAFIAGLGDVEVGEIVHRGIALMTKLLCRQPVQVPEEIVATTEAFAVEFAQLNERQRSEERRGMSTCWACHSQFEPLAYGFERFDAAGRYIGSVNARGEALPIDGWLTDDLTIEEPARPRYDDVRELMQLLADSKTVQTCMAEHFIALATGRASSPVARDFAEQVNDARADARDTLAQTVQLIVASELFRALSSSGPAPEETP